MLATHKHKWVAIRRGFPQRMCLCGAIKSRGLVVGENTITLSPAGVGDVMRWSATKAPVAAGDIGMDVATGRPQAYVGGTAVDLATVNDTSPSENATIDVVQAAHGFVVGDALRRSAGVYVKAQADSSSNAEAVGIVSAVAGVNDFTLLMSGEITGLSGLTDATVYFLSETTAGLLTTMEPTLNGTVSKPLLVATSATTGVFVNLRGIVNGGAGAAPFAEGAKAWVNFNGQGVIVIRDSYNVASLTDNGTGDYSINFGTAMANANYVITGVATHDNGSYASQLYWPNDTLPTASSARVNTLSNSFSFIDPSYVCVAIFGDAA